VELDRLPVEWKKVMNSNWVMLGMGVFLVILGIAATAVSGPMPGAKPLYRPPLRFRLILIAFGILMIVLGVVRILHL
jgi:uncharacterized membrane protein HdeD (DUF308 family)